MGRTMTLCLEGLLDPSDARHQGFWRLTEFYRVPGEVWMLERVVVDMERGGIAWVLVRTRDGVELWRKGRMWS